MGDNTFNGSAWGGGVAEGSEEGFVGGGGGGGGGL